MYQLVVIHDCLKILKTLALHRPNEATCFSLDNLYLKEGTLKIADIYISKTKVRK
jgi:hypothetical protein